MGNNKADWEMWSAGMKERQEISRQARPEASCGPGAIPAFALPGQASRLNTAFDLPDCSRPQVQAVNAITLGVHDQLSVYDDHLHKRPLHAPSSQVSMKLRRSSDLPKHLVGLGVPSLDVSAVAIVARRGASHPFIGDRFNGGGRKRQMDA
jgi:hypothetical protein